MKRVKQADKILNWLMTRGELTTRQAVNELNIMSPAKRIEELRKDGYHIAITYRTSPNGSRYGVYKLSTD